MGIRSIINIHSRSNITPTSLIVENKVKSDPIVIDNKFNNYFSSVASKLQGQIYHKGQDFTHFLKNRNASSLFINPTAEYEIINIINNLCTNKALGPHVPTYFAPNSAKYFRSFSGNS